MGTLFRGDQIGKGGYGEVYKAKLEPFDRDFALKILDPSPFHSKPEEIKARFVKEAELLMDLRHPNITPIYGVGEYCGRPYLLMEYFEGFNLNQARNAVSPMPAAVLGFVARVALALGHAHQQGVVHRDIKPSNLLTRRGDARVIDFGIAQIMDPGGERFTQAGGTPVGDAYAAPEIVDDPRLLDPRCDIYSLGACWFWLLTGTTPRGRNWESALRTVPQMTLSYENVVLKTLEQPEKRYQSTEELVRDVRALHAGSEPEANIDGDLDDESALLLGIIFQQYVPESNPTSVYRIEQELSGHLSRFALGIGLNALRRRKLVESIDVQESFGEPWQGMKVTPTGEKWIRLNRPRVEKLLEVISAPTPTGFDTLEDDIPF